MNEIAADGETVSSVGAAAAGRTHAGGTAPPGPVPGGASPHRSAPVMTEPTSTPYRLGSRLIRDVNQLADFCRRNDRAPWRPA
jgi:hypothetical protein